MERDEILQSLRDLKSQLPVDGLDQATIEEQAKRFDDARRVRERAERRIRELEEKLKRDENYRTGRVAFYDRSIEENRRDLEDMISTSDRLAADLIRADRRLEKERRNREEALTYGDEELISRIDENIARMERNNDRKAAELEALNASIRDLENFVAAQEENVHSEAIAEDIEALKEADRAEIARLNLEIRNASTESMLAEYNFATSLNDLIADVERGNITEEVVQAKLVEYRDRIPKQFLLRDAAARSEERLQLEEALAKYEPRLAELEEKLANEDNYRGVLADRLIAVRDAGQADLDRYTDEIRENGARIAEINNETRRLEQANAEAQRLIEQRRSEIEALPNQRHPMKKHLEAEIARRENEITRNITTLHSLRSEKGMLSGNIDRLRELTKPLKAEIEKINKEIAEDAKKVNKSQQRLDKLERDELLAGIAATKSRLAYIEYDISETIDRIVGDLDVSISKKAEAAKKEAERLALEAEEEAKKQEELAQEEAKKAAEKEEEKDKTPTPILLGTGGAALNGIVKEDENGKNFIIIFGPNGEELVKVEIPKNILVPEKKEEEKGTAVVAPIVEGEELAPVVPVQEEEEEKVAPIPVVEFTPASEELKEDIKKKGIIAKLKDQCKKLKEKAHDAKEWVKKHKKQLIAGGVLIAGLLVGMKGCEGNITLPENDQVIESVIEDDEIIDEEIEMPTFDFEELEDETELGDETPTKSLEEVAKDVIRGDYGNYPERKENLEAEGYDYEEVQKIVNEMMAELQPEQTEPEQTGPEQTEPEQTEPEQTEPEQTEPEQTGPEQTEPEQTEPEQTEPEQTEPEQTEPEQTEPEQTEPEQTEPEQTEPEQTEPNPDLEDELIGEEFVPVDPEPVDPEPTPDPEPDPNPDLEDELIGEEFVPVDPEPVDPEPTPDPEPDPEPEVQPELDNIVQVLPGESYVAEDGNFVQNTGDGINAEIGGDIIDIIEQDGEVAAVVGGTAETDASSAQEPVQDSGISYEEALEFYNQLGIPFAGEEFTETAPVETAEVAAEASFEAPDTDFQVPTFDETFETAPTVGEIPVFEDAIETAPVEEQVQSTDSGVSYDDALAFYAQLGLTPPENVEDNSMGGRSR